jgi:hypothetical protein
MIDLDLRVLNALREPLEKMVGFVGIDLAHMVYPRSGLAGVAKLGGM